MIYSLKNIFKRDDFSLTNINNKNNYNYDTHFSLFSNQKFNNTLHNLKLAQKELNHKFNSQNLRL